MEKNLGMNKFIPFLLLGLFTRTTYTSNVSMSDELRHPRVSGRIVKLYSGVKPEPTFCADEGFQEDPTDCAVFYRCVKGANKKYTVFRYQCGPGTVYDPDTQICNHPKSTKRIKCGGFGFATPPLAEHTNENEIDGSRQEIPSPISMKQVLYPEQNNKGDTPILSTQKYWSSSAYKSTPSEPTSNSWITTVNNHLRATRSPLPRQPNPQSGEPCTSDGFMGDSENCRKFYRCVGNGRGGYIRYEFSCSELTIWDDETQACNHAWAVRKRRCGRGNPDDENKAMKSDNTITENEVNSSETIQSQLQIAYGSKVNQVQTQISKGTVIQNQTQLNYGERTKEKPKSNAKQNQTQISHGSAVSQTQTQISHGNKGSQTQLQIDHSKESSQSQTQIHETNTDQTTTETQRPNDEKPVAGNENNECTESGFMGDSDDCKKFYRCVDNGRGGYIKYEFSCGEGTVWDPNAGACNHAWAVKDCKNQSPSQSTPQNTKTTTTTSKTTTMENIPEEDEDVGYGGQNQQPSQITTTHQDKTSTTTETSTATQTTESTDISSSTDAASENVCRSSGFMADNKDCKKFYRCVDNGNGGYTRYEFSCGEGTVWDSSLEACNHAWAVEKCGNGSPDKNTESTTTPVNNVMQNEETDNGYPSQNDNNIEEPKETTTISTTTSVSPTSSSPNTNTCKSSGFKGDENDCKKFYRCVDDGKGGYIRYEFTCGEGTVWDQSIESCNHPSSRKKCTGMETTTQETANEGTTQPTSNTQTTGDTEQNNQITTIASTEKPADKPTTNRDSCSQEGFFGDTTNCKKFYRCVENQQGGFTKYEFTCGDGTIWDQQLQTCNHESSDNKCSGISETHSENPSPESGTSTTQSAESSDTTTSTTKRPNTESNNQSNNNDQCESEGFYANSNDCKKFYRCVSNDKGGYTKYDFTCGEGTVWVQEIQACDHDNDMSNCSSQGISSTTPSSQNSQTEQPTTKSSTTTTQSTENNEMSNDCSNNSSSNSNNPQSSKCESEGFYPDNNDCKKFYRCVDNGQGGYTKYDFTCGDGTAWDPDIQACNHENQVKNCRGSQGDNQSEQGSTNESCSQTTEATGTTNTSSTESSSENKPPSANDQCEKEGYFGDSNNCPKFYRCVDNGNGGLTKYDFTCGEGTIWDQDIQTCNHPGDVQNPSCNSNTSATSTSTEGSAQTSSTSAISSSTNSPSSSTTEGQESSDCAQGSTQKPPKKQVNCTKAGFYADPDDCKKFYRCVDWDNNGQRFSVYHFDCGEGTIWDPELETCNHEDSVYPPRDCSGTQNQNSEDTTTTTTTEKSTTEETTTTEASTTEQSTTQSSTSQETTTTEETTTEQSTTTKTTTTEKSTTQQSTTEQSTTEKSTTEQTTTQSSTTEQSTTEKSTTEQPSTTEQSTTEQSSTTQQSTTSEETTTQQSTTEQSTTTAEQSTTEATTEQSSTTQQSTTQESTTAEQTTDSTTTEDNQESTTESSSSKDCPETEDDQYLYVCPTSFKRHPKYCNMFYQCAEDNDTHDLDIAVFKCPNDTIYDESKNQCVDEKDADKKCDGEKADRRRVKRLGANYKEPIVASKDKLTCPSTGHFSFEKAECSPAFLRCDQTKSGKLRGYVNQCPEGFIYWSISRRCEEKFKVRDCKKTTNDWSGRREIPINIAI